jgi:gluconolactonase
MNGIKKPSIISENSVVEKIATNFEFTEGPVWNSPGGYLLFSDIPANRIYKWIPGKKVTIFREPSWNSNGLTYDKTNGLIICEHGKRRLTRLLKNNQYEILADKFKNLPLNSPNDVVVNSDGKIYFTDPPYGIEPEEQKLDFQGIYCLDEEKNKLTLLADDFERPNGLAFSPNENILYIADSSIRRHIRAYDVGEDGSLSKNRIFTEIRSEIPGNPDGMKVDVEGNLYVAAAGGIRVFNEKSKYMGIINTPEEPANIAWGGNDWKSMFITARTSLYCVQLEVSGIKT